MEAALLSQFVDQNQITIDEPLADYLCRCVVGGIDAGEFDQLLCDIAATTWAPLSGVVRRQKINQFLRKVGMQLINSILHSRCTTLSR